MADLKFTATLDNKISPELARIQQQTSQTVAAFDRFRTAIAGLALGAAVKSALAYADSINDIASATDLAVASVIGFGKVVSASGGSTDQAQAALVKFNLSLGDAANGGLAAQAAFSELDISLRDLQTLSAQDLFNKTLEGLAGIDDTAKRARLQNELLGKSLKGVNLKDITKDYTAATAASQKYADDVRKAAQLQDQLGAAFSKLQLEILKSIEPLVTFFNNLKPEQVERFIEAVVKIGGAAAAIAVAISAVTKLAGWLAAAGTAALGLWATFSSGAAQAGKTIAGLGIRWGGFITAFTAAIGLTSKFAEVWTFLGNTFGKTIPYLLGGLARMLGPLAAVIGLVQVADLAIKAAFDFSPIDWFTDKLSRAYEGFKKFVGLSSTAPADSGAGAGRGGSDAITKQLQAQGEEMRRQSEAAKAKLQVEREAQDALKKQRNEIAQISVEFGKQLDQKASQLQIETDLIGKSEKQRDLQAAIADLNQKTTEEVDKLTRAKLLLSDAEKQLGLAADYDRQIAAVKELGKAEQIRLAALVDGLSRARALEELRKFGVQAEYDLQDKLRTLQQESADQGLSEIEKKYRAITRASEESARSAIRAEEARRGAPLSTAEAQQYYAAATAGNQQLIDQQTKLYESSRTFATGWQDAFNEYVDAATNAANQARSIFQKTTQGMEDMIVNFAKTGKFEWKSFVSSIAEELLRNNIKKLLLSTFGSIGGGGSGGLFGGAIIPGILAGGGPVSTNRPYIVGEQGPELFVPTSAGNMMPNRDIGGGGSVTYNINAVDAASFQALVARDPAFIHAVAQQGAQSMPRRR